MTLGEKQELFAELEAKWVLWVLSHPGWRLRHGEGRILPLGPDGKSGRKAETVSGKTNVRVEDLVHKRGGLHYQGLAADWELFVNGDHVISSDHPAWLVCGEKWESMHELCRWGGRFTPSDGNHLSITHGGLS
jgi:hypothetical protein